MSMLNNNTSLNKINKKANVSKSKANNLLLTDFNKFSLFNYNSKTTKKKIHINNKTYSNNSIKNQKKKNSTKKIINNYNNINHKLNNHKIQSNIGPYSSYNNNINHLMNNNNISNTINNNNMKEKKSIEILDINNIPKQSSKTIKCNSVNNLIGININVNYMNKNYSINKIRPNSYMTNYNNNYNIYNNNSRHIKGNSVNKISDINNNNIHGKLFNNSFNEMNKGNNNINNIPHSSSGKNKINKKNIFIINPLRNDWEKIIENLKSKKLSKSKIDKKEISKNSKNQIENKNTISSIEENNNYNNNINFSYNINKTNFNAQNIEKSLSCKNINFIPIHKAKKTNNNKNVYCSLIQNMNKKINKLNKNEINDNYINNELFDIIRECLIKYSKEIEDQYQKQFILEIICHLNNIFNKKENILHNIEKEKEECIQKNKLYKNKYEKIIEQNNILIQKNNNLQNKINELSSKLKNTSTNNIKIDIDNNNVISSINNNNDESLCHSNNSSSSVNSEELESIRFFDKIIMKKHSFIGVPELSFQKLNNKEINNKKDIILPYKKNIKQRHSFQEKNNMKIMNMNDNKKKEINTIKLKGLNNNMNDKKNKYYSGNIKNHHKQKINIRYKQYFKK